ncbi:hypothetical protein MMC29_002171 [Sticta canariensis]|nr:hypothetical protein [Sticta canariensis]
MEESEAQAPKPNELVFYPCEDYALASAETTEAAEFLMTKLEPINLEDDDLGTQVCPICQQDFSDSEDVKHTPVKITCGHIFGKICIIRWLNPLCGWGLKENDVEAVTWPDCIGRSGCPICRKSFFDGGMIEPMEDLAQRLSFWDMAYAAAGVAWSARQERSRKILWEYVAYCRSMNDYESDDQWTLGLAQARLWRWARNLKYEKLTPLQESLRVKLDRIGRKDLTKCAFNNGSYVFDLDRDDDEVTQPNPWYFVGITDGP